MKKEPDWARWRTWLIAASATAVPSGVTSACGSVEVVCGGIGDYSGKDASNKVDATRPDAGVSVVTCKPGDIAAFVPEWKPPTGFHQGACTDEQAAMFVDCIARTPDAGCTTFGAPVNRPCFNCLASSPIATKYGPLIEGPITIRLNVAGCIAEETGDLSDGGCAAKVLAAAQCAQAACDLNCPLASNDDGASFAALLACESDSTTSSCSAFANDARCADVLTADGGVAAACAQGASFAENAKTMVKLFCGGAGDGGITDSGSDG